MNGEKLLYAIGEIDEKFINELDIKQNRKNFTKPILMAASLIIIISGILFGRYNQGDVATDPNGETPPPIVADETENDEEFEDLLHASDDVRVRCSDCGSEYTKRELLDSNAAIIDNAVDELAQDAVKELEKELKKAMKKWKF